MSRPEDNKTFKEALNFFKDLEQSGREGKASYNTINLDWKGNRTESDTNIYSKLNLTNYLLLNISQRLENLKIPKAEATSSAITPYIPPSNKGWKRKYPG